MKNKVVDYENNMSRNEANCAPYIDEEYMEPNKKRQLKSFFETLIGLLPLGLLIVFLVNLLWSISVYAYESSTATIYIGKIIDTEVLQKQDSIENEFWVTFELKTGDIQKFKMKDSESSKFFNLEIGEECTIKAHIKNDVWLIFEFYVNKENNETN